MNTTFEQTTKEFLEKYNIRASKKLGQNFLIDKHILDKIIQASELTKSNVIVEIGPGIGTLTEELAKVVSKVIAIEKDSKLSKILKKKMLQYQNVEIIEDDIMSWPVSPTLPAGGGKRGLRGAKEGERRELKESERRVEWSNYNIVANLPYNIALPIIRKFVEHKNPPKKMILMLQKEVAQKICDKKSSLPKIAIELYAKSEILFFVPKESFFPMPKVDGAVIKISDIQKNVPNIDKALFFKILKAGFAHPRKTILNNLSKKLDIEKQEAKKWLEKCDISPQYRPENLNLKNWIKLVNSFNF